MASTTEPNKNYKIAYEGRDQMITVGIDPGAKKDMPKIAKIVAQEAKDLDQIIKSAEGPFRPFDGAAAFARAIRKTFDTDGVGQVTRSFFGNTPPLFIDVQVQNLIYLTGDGRRVKEDAFYDVTVWPIQDLVSYAVSEGVSVPSPYGERDRPRIVDDLISRWESPGVWSRSPVPPSRSTSRRTRTRPGGRCSAWRSPLPSWRRSWWTSSAPRSCTS